MKNRRFKNLLLITVLMAATGAALAYSKGKTNLFFQSRSLVSPQHQPKNIGIVGIYGHLVQNKVLQGSDGILGLNLTLQAEEIEISNNRAARNVDLVIVLDRSGSMQGRKINDARQAVLKLLTTLSAKDRFALVTYSDDAQIASGLMYVTRDNQNLIESAVNRIRVGGGTNLGAGLQAGINLLSSIDRNTNAAKVILISDGLANKGITDVRSLSAVAAAAVEKEFAVSTVGVGDEFNEYLMTAIADQGTGSYYYLENPAAFAEVFQKEFYATRASIADNLKIQIPLRDGIDLAEAAGYPITYKNGYAVFHPGNLLSGQTRKLYLTLRVPTTSLRNFELKDIKITYHHNSQIHETVLKDSFAIACIKDQRKVYSSIDKTSWTEKVINEDFNRLKQEVAVDLKSGKKQAAINRIRKYHGEQQAMNAVVGSARVAHNLDEDLKELELYVEETFHGDPQVVREKQKSNAKALQYDGYRGRRK